MTGFERCLQYCDWVEKNPSQVCKYIRLAVKRFRTDYSKVNAPEYPYYFDVDAANRFIAFAECLKQYKGETADMTLTLEPWQCFIFSNIYGFKARSDNQRRFRKAFCFVGRKNGKTQMMVASILWNLLNEPGAECYCAANKREQSKILFEAIKQSVLKNSALSSRLRIYNSTSRIVNEKLAGKIEALAADSDTMDGLNPSVVVVDELSAMKNFDIIQILQSGMGQRRSPLLLEITSGSDDLTSAGKSEFDRSAKVLENVVHDDTYFCVLYTLDEHDSWKDPSVWIKANPNLGVSLKPDFLEKFSLEAQQQPALETEFRTKCCTQWLSNSHAWISAKAWSEAEANAKKYRLDLDRPYFAVGSIDLSKRNDLTVFTVIAFQDGRYYLDHRMYFPEQSLSKRVKHENELWRKWTEQGHIRSTPGEVINYAYMLKDIIEISEVYRLEEILFDPYNSTTLINELGDRFELVEIPQSIKMMSPYAKAFEEEVLAGNVVDDNPVMKWAVSNCQIYTDPNGNIKPIKIDDHRDSRHIDSVITSLMGIGRIRQLNDAGEIDLRTPDQVMEETKAFLQGLNIFGPR